MAMADSPDVDTLISKIAQQEEVDPILLRAIVATESEFNNQTVSPNGAIGLMQLMPETARTVGVTNIHNPEQNLRGGARYLKKMLQKFPKLPHALAAYNAGPGTVTRHQGIPPVPETKRYVGKVMNYYHNASKQKITVAKKKSLNAVYARVDASDLVYTNNSYLSSTKPLPNNTSTPLLSIRRTNTQVRHDLTASIQNPKQISKSTQFAMAYSEPIDGDFVPILRAAQ